MRVLDRDQEFCSERDRGQFQQHHVSFFPLWWSFKASAFTMQLDLTGTCNWRFHDQNFAEDELLSLKLITMADAWQADSPPALGMF
jgi:hypothetical protein